MRDSITEALTQICDEELNNLPEQISQAIRYALTGGGKYLRGQLLIASYQAAKHVGQMELDNFSELGIGATSVSPQVQKNSSNPSAPSHDPTLLASALEIIHTYSLVHDDLPCMDNDDVRRGRPSVHKQFGVEVATVAGVAMVPLAVLAVSRGARALQLPREAQHTIVKVLTQAAGASGMIGGQLLDLMAEGWSGSSVALEELEAIHKAKTGALIAASARIGGIAAQSSEDVVEALYQFGAKIGHAFQIVDDVLDVTATSETLGKPAGSDVKLGKSTYPALLGIDGARKRAEDLVAEGCDILNEKNLLTTDLKNIAQFTIKREY